MHRRPLALGVCKVPSKGGPDLALRHTWPGNFSFIEINSGGVRIMWEQLRIIQEGHLKIRGTRKNSNMRGHTKFLGGLKK